MVRQDGTSCSPVTIVVVKPISRAATFRPETLLEATESKYNSPDSPLDG